VLLGNVSAATVDQCEAFGYALVNAYQDAPLPLRQDRLALIQLSTRLDPSQNPVTCEHRGHERFVWGETSTA